MKSVLIATAEPPLPNSPEHSVGSFALAMARAVRASGGRAALVTPAIPLPPVTEPAQRKHFQVLPGSTPCRVDRQTMVDGLQVYWVDIADAFPRECLYSDAGAPHPDNARRFTLFSRAAVEVARRLSPRPTHLHLFDWPAALAAALVKEERLPFQCVTHVFDPRYQGFASAEEFPGLGLPAGFFRRETGEYFGRFSLLKCGVAQSGRICALSDKHARRLWHDASGMEGVFSSNRHLFSHLPPSVSALAAIVSAASERGPAKLNSRRVDVTAGPASANRIFEFFEALDLLAVMGFETRYRPGEILSAERFHVELARRRHVNSFCCAPGEDSANNAGIALFLDDASLDPLPALRAWFAGKVVCAPAIPALEDTRSWLAGAGFDTGSLLIYRSGGAAAIYDVVSEAGRFDGQHTKPSAAAVAEAAGAASMGVMNLCD